MGKEWNPLTVETTKKKDFLEKVTKNLIKLYRKENPKGKITPSKKEEAKGLAIRFWYWICLSDLKGIPENQFFVRFQKSTQGHHVIKFINE